MHIIIEKIISIVADWRRGVAEKSIVIGHSNHHARSVPQNCGADFIISTTMARYCIVLVLKTWSLSELSSHRMAP